MPRPRPAFLAALLTALVLAPLARAADAPAAAAAKKAFGVDDLWAVKRVGAPVLSPDGARAAYAVTAYEGDEMKANADLWLVDVASGASRRLTANKASDTSPAFSPDGRRLAFVSKRDGDAAAQLYVLPLDGGEAERLTDLPTAVSNPKWFPDGARIAFLANVVAGAESPEETKKALEKREKNPVKAHTSENRLFRYWDHWLTDGEYPHLFVVDVATKKVTDLTPGSKRYFGLDEGGSFDISPDGKSIVFAANSTPEPYTTLNWDLFLVPAAGGEVKNLTPARAGRGREPGLLAGREDDRVRHAAQGRRLARLHARRAPRRRDRRGSRLLTDGWENSCAGWAFAKDGKSIVFTAEARARTNLYAVPVDGRDAAPRLEGRDGRRSRPSRRAARSSSSATT